MAGTPGREGGTDQAVGGVHPNANGHVAQAQPQQPAATQGQQQQPTQAVQPGPIGQAAVGQGRPPSIAGQPGQPGQPRHSSNVAQTNVTPAALAEGAPPLTPVPLPFTAGEDARYAAIEGVTIWEGAVETPDDARPVVFKTSEGWTAVWRGEVPVGECPSNFLPRLAGYDSKDERRFTSYAFL